MNPENSHNSAIDVLSGESEFNNGSGTQKFTDHNYSLLPTASAADCDDSSREDMTVELCVDNGKAYSFLLQRLTLQLHAMSSAGFAMGSVIFAIGSMYYNLVCIPQ